MHRIINSLAFRIIAPVTIIVILTGAIFYLFALRSMSDFVYEHIKGMLGDVSRSIYSICDTSLNELLRAGLFGDEKAVRIKKAVTIGMIEDFLRANNIDGIVFEEDKEVMRTANYPAGLLAIPELHKSEGMALTTFYHNNQRYYGWHLDFEPWKWSIYLISGAEEYSTFINKVRLAYIVTGGVLLTSALMLIYYLKGILGYPTRKIITSIKRGTLPEYKGIYEFEFLSDSLREMMLEKERLTKMLVQEEKLRGIGVLAFGVAHNFNNLLVAILGYASLIKLQLEEAKRENQTVLPEGMEEMIKRLSIIEQSAQKASILSKQLSALSRRRGKEDALAVFNVNDIVLMVKGIISPVLSKDIELSINLTQGIPDINGNSLDIEQALLNLCLNAKDAMPEGGRLTIETDYISITEKCPENPFLSTGDYVTIKVSDTGIGMDEEVLGRIFEPFYTTKSPDKGIGMGLAVAWATVKAHGGYVTAESKPNKGSIFTIFLPVVKH